MGLPQHLVTWRLVTASHQLVAALQKLELGAHETALDAPGLVTELALLDRMLYRNKHQHSRTAYYPRLVARLVRRLRKLGLSQCLAGFREILPLESLPRDGVTNKAADLKLHLPLSDALEWVLLQLLTAAQLVEQVEFDIAAAYNSLIKLLPLLPAARPSKKLPCMLQCEYQGVNVHLRQHMSNEETAPAQKLDSPFMSAQEDLGERITDAELVHLSASDLQQEEYGGNSPMEKLQQPVLPHSMRGTPNIRGSTPAAPLQPLQQLPESAPLLPSQPDSAVESILAHVAASAEVAPAPALPAEPKSSAEPMPSLSAAAALNGMPSVLHKDTATVVNGKGNNSHASSPPSQVIPKAVPAFAAPKVAVAAAVSTSFGLARPAAVIKLATTAVSTPHEGPRPMPKEEPLAAADQATDVHVSSVGHGIATQASLHPAPTFAPPRIAVVSSSVHSSHASLRPSAVIKLGSKVPAEHSGSNVRPDIGDIGGDATAITSTLAAEQELAFSVPSADLAEKPEHGSSAPETVQIPASFALPAVCESQRLKRNKKRRRESAPASTNPPSSRSGQQNKVDDIFGMLLGGQADNF
eukprot:jgi/Chlat1/4910/Chrsp31S04840